jgi:hypothetical protein
MKYIVKINCTDYSNIILGIVNWNPDQCTDLKVVIDLSGLENNNLKLFLITLVSPTLNVPFGEVIETTVLWP